MRKIALLLLFFAMPAFAADETVVIRAARLIDGRSDTTASPALVVVKGNKIESIGGTPPAGARIIDLGDATLMPGLIDAHAHLLLQGDVTQEEYDVQLFKESLAYRALRASRAAKIALEHGFTSMRDIGNEGAMYTDVDVKRAINEGVIPGPRLQVATRAMSVTGGYGPSGYQPDIVFPKGVQIVDGVEGAQSRARAGRQRRGLDQGLRRSLVLGTAGRNALEHLELHAR